ncbi:hypothetical protein GOP47_0006073 [Adiantum capillus-veneris]|uniref:J domain-containing protein n=1 Tax=Adiantum capillus-veneris TaxID=13818 RepID=A0A9D4V3Q1_ADICA|nr:hypothetical protein GOP47_0006073 [Adiantum capillus-veneris]
MPGREGWDVHGHEEWEQQNKRRSYVWPAIALFMTGLAVAHMISLKRRLQNYERFAREAFFGETGPGSTSRDGASQARHASSRSNNNTYGRDSGQTGTFHFTYWTSDGRQHTVRRDIGGNSEPWARIFQDAGFFGREDAERLERMRRMAEAFHRERAHYTRSYERWQEAAENSGDPKPGTRDDWSWTKSDWETWKNADPGRSGTSQRSWGSPYAKHYRTLGLDESKAGTYSQADIKAAYRAKAMEYHPDRNQNRREYAEAKFREVVAAYEALKK